MHHRLGLPRGDAEPAQAEDVHPRCYEESAVSMASTSACLSVELVIGTSLPFAPDLPTKSVGVEETLSVTAWASACAAVSFTDEVFASESIFGTFNPRMLAAVVATMLSSSQPVFSFCWLK